MRSQPHVLGIVLAGGEGKRLYPLTKDRAKPAVPFGSSYRLIDFVLSNLVNAGYERICVLTQYKSHSLDRHISQTWWSSGFHGEFITPVPAHGRLIALARQPGRGGCRCPVGVDGLWPDRGNGPGSADELCTPLWLHVEQGARHARPGQGAVRGGGASAPGRIPHGLRKHGGRPCYLEGELSRQIAQRGAVAGDAAHTTAHAQRRVKEGEAMGSGHAGQGTIVGEPRL